MQKRTFVLLTLTVVAVSGFLAVQLSAADPDAKKIRWFNDLDAAHRVSLQENRPMLLVISADWCRHCRKLSSNTLTDPELVDHVNASFVPVQLDLDRNKRIAKVLGVRSIPCSIVLSPRADLLGRIAGHAEPAKYRETLRASRRLQEQIEQANLSAQSGTP